MQHLHQLPQCQSNFAGTRSAAHPRTPSRRRGSEPTATRPLPWPATSTRLHRSVQRTPVNVPVRVTRCATLSAHSGAHLVPAPTSLLQTCQWQGPRRPAESRCLMRPAHPTRDLHALIRCSFISCFPTPACQVLIADRNLTVREAAQLFALLNAATWDASIAAYTEKYAQPSWRPITAIRWVLGGGRHSEGTAWASMHPPPKRRNHMRPTLHLRTAPALPCAAGRETAATLQQHTSTPSGPPCSTHPPTQSTPAATPPPPPPPLPCSRLCWERRRLSPFAPNTPGWTPAPTRVTQEVRMWSGRRLALGAADSSDACT